MLCRGMISLGDREICIFRKDYQGRTSKRSMKALYEPLPVVCEHSCITKSNSSNNSSKIWPVDRRFREADWPL